jgi:hypothetical protein
MPLAQLTFAGDTLEILIGAFDAVLGIAAVGRKQLNNLACCRCQLNSDAMLQEVEFLANAEFMLRHEILLPASATRTFSHLLKQ